MTTQSKPLISQEEIEARKSVSTKVHAVLSIIGSIHYEVTVRNGHFKQEPHILLKVRRMYYEEIYFPLVHKENIPLHKITEWQFNFDPVWVEENKGFNLSPSHPKPSYWSRLGSMWRGSHLT